MTFNTGNNVPSTDPRDLYDNAENLDKLINGAEPFYADRKGKLRESWAGMENSFTNAQEDRENTFMLSQSDKESRFQAFLVSSGYVSKGDYAAGVVLAERNEYVAVDAVTTGTAAGLYRPNASATLPLTLTGTWSTDSASLVLLGDDVLRQELASAEGAAMSGYTLDPLAATISRTVYGVLREVSFSVTDFGAKGDGVSDDTPAFLAAVAWCRANGAHLRVPKPASFYVLAATIPLSSDALAPVSVIGDVPQWMGGESIMISGDFDGPLFSANGTPSLYAIAPAICNVSLRNLNTGTSACAIQSNYSSGLRVEHVSIQHCNYGIHSAAEMISPSFVEVCMVTPLGYTPGNVGIAGYKLAARNTRIFGGRVYSQQVCLDYSGDIVSVMGLNCEFSQVIFRHGALASAVFVGCHFETSQVLLSNAPQLPINYESAWSDNGSIGSGITGSVSFIGGVCYLDSSKSNLVVIKSGPSFTYSLNIEGMAVNHPNKIAGSSFALNSKVALPAGTKIRVRDCLLDVAYPPSDQYSGYDVETGSDGQRHVDKLRVNVLRSGRLVEGVVVPNGGYVDVPTGMGQFSNAVFDLAWRAFSGGAEYTGTLIAVQAYDQMIFGSRTGAGISSAETDWTVSWVPEIAAVRLTNASGVQKTVTVNIQARHQM